MSETVRKYYMFLRCLPLFGKHKNAGNFTDMKLKCGVAAGAELNVFTKGGAGVAKVWDFKI